eukprot:763675-Prorocentrum_lima.AAC.1
MRTMNEEVTEWQTRTGKYAHIKTLGTSGVSPAVEFEARMKIHNSNLVGARQILIAAIAVENRGTLEEMKSGLTSLAEHMESSVSFSERRMQLQNLPTSIKIVGRDVIVSQILEDLEPSGSM